MRKLFSRALSNAVESIVARIRELPVLKQRRIEQQFEPLESRVLLSTSINFQPSTAAVPTGYTVDDGSVYATHGALAYGWSASHTGVAFDRNVSSYQRLDTLIEFHSGGKWEIAEPNGSYVVKVSIGDPSVASTHTLNVEGTNYWNAQSLAANKFLQKSMTVTVSDGKLTLDSGSAADGATRINFIEIESAGATPPAPASLTAAVVSGTEIKLAWRDLALTETGYRIQKSTDGVNYTTVTTAPANTTGQLVKGLDPAKSYTFRVTATGSGSDSSSVTSSSTSTASSDPSGWYRVKSIGSIHKGDASYNATGTLTINNTGWIQAGSEEAAIEKAVSGSVHVDETGEDYSFPGGAFRYNSSFSAAGGKAIVLEDLYNTENNDSDYNDDYFPIEVEMRPTIPDCDCDGHSQAAGASGGSPAANGSSAHPVRYFDGTVSYSASDLPGHSRSWTNLGQVAPNNVNGYGMTDTQWPSLLQGNGDNSIAVVYSGTDQVWFDLSGSTYNARYFSSENLLHSGGEFVLTDTLGNKTHFYDFANTDTALRGQFKSYTDASGNTTSSTYTSGKLTETQQSMTVGGVTKTTYYAYSYYTSGAANGLLANVSMRHQLATTPVVRQVDYAYYDGTESFGNVADLKTATVKDGAGSVIDETYYRYYTSGEADGYTHGLKYVFNPEAFARLAAAFANPFTASDAQVAPYADNYFKYDTERRVVQETVRGEGASGLGTYTYSYSAPSTFTGTDAFNTWRYKTIETLPDGNLNIVYGNDAGETMLKVFKETSTGKQWGTFYKYDSQGRLIMTAHSSAFQPDTSGNIYDETTSTLLDNSSGTYRYLKNSDGKIDLISYYGSTTASETAVGGVAGYEDTRSIQRGQTGTPIPVSRSEYRAHSAGGATIYLVASSIAYSGTGATGARKTSYTYKFVGDDTPTDTSDDTLQKIWMKIIQPPIQASQNGPASSSTDSANADTETDYFDTYGRVAFSQDGDGFITYTEYDPATGAVVRTIADVNTGRDTDHDGADSEASGGQTFTGLPAGLTTPTGGGLHLVTSYEVDDLGRTTEQTNPAGNITYTVYKDSAHEIRTYRGWTTSNTTTGPIEVSREDRGAGFVDTLTISGAPHLDASNQPDGGETIGDAQHPLQSLSRGSENISSQIASSDRYFSFTGMTYPTSMGSESTTGSDGNYYRTLYKYDAMGRVTGVKDAVGTITQSVYDALGRNTSTWIGTNDLAATGQPGWSSFSTSGTSNMVQVNASEYDNNGVGNGDLTKLTQYPGGGTANRETDLFYDWRDRPVATKSGVQSGESSTPNTQRPIIYSEYNNLDELTASSQYDGDGLTISDADGDGVPDAPTSSQRRAKTVQLYDDQGRIYRTSTYSVDQSNGNLATNTLNTDTWYDHRGDAVKVASPGQAVSKFKYDGAGRITSNFATNGGSDASWTDANNVSDDVVLEQQDNFYDKSGNVIFTARNLRFHDDWITAGELGYPDSGTAAAARVYYNEAFYDLADRLLASVDLGTNGGSALTERPDSAVPSSSDSKHVTSYGYDAAGQIGSTTDPRGLVTDTLYDALGRTTKTIENYVDGTPSADTDRTTEYTYDGADHVLTQKAVLPGSTFQTTRYVYGVTTAAGSDITSNDLLATIKFPDKTTGGPSTSASDQQSFKYNALGETKSKTDQRGTVHAYEFDVLGRLTADAVPTLGNASGLVKRLEYTYDTGGRLYELTSTNSASSGGTMLNKIRREYNGLGQLIREYQNHSGGTINTSTTPKVQYAYSEMASGANHSRLISMTYPSGKVIRYSYSGAGGLNDSISRLYAVQEDLPTGATSNLERYQYLGLDTIIKRDRPQNNVDLSYVNGGSSDVGDQYTGLDSFGQVVDQRWNDPSGTDYDRYQYGYDRDGNVQYKTNVLSTANSELYHADGSTVGYDGLNRLTDFQRGSLSDSNSDGIPDTVATSARSQTWSLDQLGNWNSINSDGTSQTRTQNDQNQITSVSGATTPTYDESGDTTKDETGKNYVYDAWNRLKEVRDSSSTLISYYTYDAAGRRITAPMDDPTDYYYSDNWQIIEERDGTSPISRNIWSPVYVDAMIMRERDLDTGSDGALDTTFGSGGKVTTDIPGVGDISLAAATYYGGKLIAVGYGDLLDKVMVIRYNEDGSLDTTFGGGNGYVTTDLTASNDLGFAVAVQDDGKIVVGGTYGGWGNEFLVLRYTSDGDLDTTFSSNGWATAAIAGNVNSVAIQPDGKIVAVGANFQAARFNADGSVDTTFSSDGMQSISTGGSGSANAVSILGDGTILIAGYVQDAVNYTYSDFVIAKLGSDGNLDTSFGSSGIEKFDSAAQDWDEAYGMAVQSDGKIVVAGSIGADMGVARFNTDGSIDNSFDTDGQQTIDFGGTEVAKGVAIASDGKIVLGGYRDDDTTFARVMALGRLTASGAVDNTFGTAGKLTTDFGTGDEQANAVLIQHDGQIVAIGSAGNQSETALARYSVDPGFEERLYALNDANYNVTALADTNGAVVERYQYDPYGKVKVLDANWSADADGVSDWGWQYLHQGGRLDNISGLYNFRNRDLSPTLGRWMSRDPMGYVDGLNLYQYVDSTPLSALDPYGLVRSGSIEPVRGEHNFGWGIGPMSHTKHEMTLKFPRGTNLDSVANTIYRDFKSFKHFGPNDATASVSSDDIATFTANMPLASKLNPLIQVRLYFDDPSLTVYGVTLGPHMLVGIRRWSVKPDKSQCAVIVTTEAYERARLIMNSDLPPGVNQFGKDTMGAQQQKEIWYRYLKNIAAAWLRSGAESSDVILTRPPDDGTNMSDAQNPFIDQSPGFEPGLIDQIVP